MEFSGGSYLTTIRDSSGNVASRSVFTLHADRTMSGMDSGQGGPAFFFSSQRGAWKPAGHRRVAARMIDFLLPNGAGIARMDYSITFANGDSRVAGTITLRIFDLDDGSILDNEGSIVDTFTFVGELIKPQWES